MPIPIAGNRSVMRTTSLTSLAFALLAFAALALATSPPDAAGRLSFDQVEAVVGSSTTATQARDLNGDGRLDLVVPVAKPRTMSRCFFGIAGGAFEHRDHSSFGLDVSPHPHAVRLHDIDSDGHADLLVDDRSSVSIRLFRGRGDGTFSGATLTGSWMESRKAAETC